jgi:methyl-accepting chemotaxis protein
MNRLRLRTKIGLVIAVMVATAVAIAAVGYYQLGMVNERVKNMIDVTAQAYHVSEMMQRDMQRSRRYEMRAVLSTNDEDSKNFVEHAAHLSRDVDQYRAQLSALLDPDPASEERRLLEQFNRSWEELESNQKQALPLAMQNSNHKAHVLSRGKISQSVAVLDETLNGTLKQVEKELADAGSAKDAPRLVAADRKARALQRLLLLVVDVHRGMSLNVMDTSDEEMDRLDTSVAAMLKEADTLLADLSAQADDKERAALTRATAALADLQAQSSQMRRLLRVNSVSRATAIQLGATREAADNCMESLGKLNKLLDAKLESDLKKSQESSAVAKQLMIGVAVVGIAVSVLLALLLTRSITQPIARGVALSEAIAGGDLTQRLKLNQTDEVGALTGAMDRVADSFSSALCEIHRVAKNIGNSSQELATVSHQLLAQSEEMATQAGHVASSTEQMSTNINTMAAAAEQMSVNVVSISSASEEISVNVGSISSAAEATAKTVGAVTNSIQNATHAFETIAADVRQESQVTGKAMEMAAQATATMNSLDRSASEINKVTEAIKMIALQTNLLALNATIEATSAGEAGKGFAVVAHEIKELANQSAQAAEDIARKIEAVQAGTREAVGVIQGVAEIIHAINDSAARIAGEVEKLTHSANTSAASLGEASTNVGNIAGSISEVAKGANDMSRNAGEAAKGANDVSRNASEAAVGVRDISSNIHGVGQATKDNAASAQRVNSAADRLRGIADELQKIVGRFKIGG